jgi:hypothetical protein
VDIGCHLPNQGPLATGEAVATFAREADRRGMASLWVSDHVVFPRTATGSYPGGRFPHPPGKPYLEPVVTLAAAAMCTTRARLGASVFILGHRHPVVSLRFTLSDELLGKGAPAVVDQLAAYKRLGLRHILLEFRRDDLGRMLEILDLVAGTIRPAVERA